jgi:esterase/lipase superfamily enzyme
MNRVYHKWHSKILQRDMELLIFGHAGKAVLFFPTRMARFFDYENWGIIDALRERIDNGELQIFCVDSIDAESFYNEYAHPGTRIARYIQYEQYILHEVLPLMRKTNPGTVFTAAGCSMGAYHAANIAFKHPSFFNKMVCMSGRYDLTLPIHNFRDLFDGFRNEDIYFNMPGQFMANMNSDAALNLMRRMDIILAVGETDPFKAANQEFSDLLWSKDIPNHLYIWGNFAHTPRYWKQMVRLYF